MKTTLVKYCINCGNKAHSQDKIHGKGKRLHVLAIKILKWRCTRCGIETTATQNEINNRI